MQMTPGLWLAGKLARRPSYYLLPLAAVLIGLAVIFLPSAAQPVAAETAPTKITLTISGAPSESPGFRTVSEDVGTVTVIATLDQPAGDGGVSVTLTTYDLPGLHDTYVPATAGSDFKLPSTFTIAKGQTSSSADITIMDDTEIEKGTFLNYPPYQGEWIFLTANTTTSGIEAGTATILIQDNGEFWSGTLSVDWISRTRNGCAKDPLGYCLFLTPSRKFDYDGITYDFTNLAVDGNYLIVSVWPKMTESFQDLTLSVGDRKFRFFDGHLLVDGHYIVWKNHGLTWRRGHHVKLGLSRMPQGNPSELRLGIDTAPIKKVSIPDEYWYGEDAGSFPVVVRLNQPAGDEGVTVTLTGGDAGTAAFGKDYTVSPATLTIPKGKRSARVTLTIVDDSEAEGDETISLSATTNQTGITVHDFTARIHGSDGPPPVEFWSATLTVQDLESAYLGCNDAYADEKPALQCRSALTSNTFNYDASSYTLYYVRDDHRGDRQLHFSGGTVSPYWALLVDNAKQPANVETWSWHNRLRWSYPDNKRWHKYQQVRLSLENRRSYAISDATAAEGENAELSITLGENAPANGLQFTVATNFAGSATATAEDVGATPTTVTVPAGQRKATLSIPIAADSEAEAAETFTVAITPTRVKSHSWHGDGSATVTIPANEARQEKQAQGDATLAGLALGNAVPGSSAPVAFLSDFAADYAQYYVDVLSGVTSVTVTPTATAGAAATITVGLAGDATPETVTSGSASGAITVNPNTDRSDPNVINVVVTNGSSAKTYQISISHVDPLSFGSASIADQVYTVGAEVDGQGMPLTQLPAADGSDSYHKVSYSAAGLPAGLEMTADRVIRGTPTSVALPTTVTYTAADTIGSSASLTFQVSVMPAVQLSETNVATVEYTIGQADPLNEVLPEASGGEAPLTYHLELTHDGSDLANFGGGINFDAATRTITGRGTSPDKAALTYVARDANGSVADAYFSIYVVPAPTLPAIADKTFYEGDAIGGADAQLPAAEGGARYLKGKIGSLTYSLAPLPLGVAFDSSTRTLSGTPTSETAPSTTVTYTVTDRNGVSDSATFDINVVPGLNAPEAPALTVYVRGPMVALDWPDAARAARYVVQVKPSEDDWPADVAPSAPDGVRITMLPSRQSTGGGRMARAVVRGLTQGGEYHVRVAAVNDDGASPWSATWRVVAGNSATPQ